jgi:hypothetical protein
MHLQQKRSKSPSTGRRNQKQELDAVQIAANSYCLQHYAVGYTGGTPRQLSLQGALIWIVPVVLTSPGYGVVGEVGIVAIDGATKKVLDATRREEVKAAGTLLARGKRDEIAAAFHRARKL